MLSILNAYSQINWYGYGIGMSHIEFKDKTITYRTYDNNTEETYTYAKIKSGNLLLNRGYKDEYEYQPIRKIEFLNAKKDSLSLRVGKRTYKFYKDPKNINLKPFDFHSFTYELLGSLKETIEKIELSKYGVLRETDETNRTIFEIELEKSELNKFYQELNKLDIQNLHFVNRSYNFCNSTEHSLTFVNQYKERFTYTSIELVAILKPIVQTVKDMLSKQKQKSH